MSSPLLFGLGALGFLRKPPDLGTERRTTGTAGFWDDLSAGNEFVKPSSGGEAVGFLGAMFARRDDENAVTGDAIPRQRAEPLTYAFRQRRGVRQVETQLDGRGHFVDVLSPRPGGTHRGDGQFGIWNVDWQEVLLG